MNNRVMNNIPYYYGIIWLSYETIKLIMNHVIVWPSIYDYYKVQTRMIMGLYDYYMNIWLLPMMYDYYMTIIFYDHGIIWLLCWLMK